MILVATAVFLYYTIWTLFMVNTPSSSFVSCCCPPASPTLPCALLTQYLPQPFVDENIELHNFFPPRVWAIRIPLAIVLVGVAVVGSFLSMVMIKAGQKKRAKLAAAAGVKKKT
jgi:dolichyl-phosphate mannosyltransferase polypeptide 2 regulatory subunit